MTTDILAQLSAPFPPDVISWRVGSTMKDKTKGMALAYIDARDVQDRLNQVCGLNWQVRNPWSVNGKLACEIGIKIGDEWVWRGDGAGDSDVEAEKGAFSDAFKRAAVRFGIGRYLYDVDSPWVALEAKGNSYIIAPGEIGKLRACLGKASGVRAASPAPAPATNAPATKPARDDAFYKRDSYEINPREVGSWTDWEATFRTYAAGCKTYAEWTKFEDDNLSHRNKYTAKASPEVCNSLLAFVREVDGKLNPALKP